MTINTLNVVNYTLVRLCHSDILNLRPIFQFIREVFSSLAGRKGLLSTSTKDTSRCSEMWDASRWVTPFWLWGSYDEINMTYKTLSKICVGISGSSIVYMFLITYEGTNFGWTIFFVFLAFAILFHELDKQEEEISILHSPKENKQEEEKKWKAHLKELAETDPRSNNPFYLSDKHGEFKKQIVANLEKVGKVDTKEKTTNLSKKSLISLISTKGKTSGEVAQEAIQNFQKYNKIKVQVESKNNDKN